MAKFDIDLIISWYDKNRRPLPWRNTRDPYKIWISETMLQQTTSAAVIPYYKRFIRSFPNIKSLAKAQLNDVFQHWAGLGYYSRARNLHAAASKIYEKGSFPQTWQDLITLPGFGPYTARAVSSIAFNETVGVLDGNVIRFLTRYYNLECQWWKSKDRQTLQNYADQIASLGQSRVINQALMEIGATICTPKSPQCIMCPAFNTCQARQQGTVLQRPLTRPKRAKEVWLWSAQVTKKNDQVFLVHNNYTSFLRNQMIFPGRIKRLKSNPKRYNFRHTITHHDIYVRILKDQKLQCNDGKWIAIKQLAKTNPSSLLQKVLTHL